MFSVEEVNELRQEWTDACSVDVLMASYLQKKLQKELPASGNDPALQEKIDDAKSEEWSTLLSKGAVRVHVGRRAQEIRKHHQDRFIGSLFVITRKASNEENPVDLHNPSTYQVKGRWCLQGHLDPDLTVKASEGMLQSPTLSQIGRNLLMQIIASHQWTLQLGDIKGAFS